MRLWCFTSSTSTRTFGMKRMKKFTSILFLVLAGCSAQPYAEIKVWTSTNAPSDPAWVQIGGKTDAVHTICIQSDNARLSDLVQKIAEHENLKVEFDAKANNAFCTVNLLDVEPINGIESILDMHDCIVFQSNNVLVVQNKKNSEPSSGLYQKRLKYNLTNQHKTRMK